MAAEAKFVGSTDDYEKGTITVGGIVEPGDVLQYHDGRACIVVGSNDVASGQVATVALSGEWEATAASTINYLKGIDLWWDESANTVNFRSGAAGDFQLGVCNEAVATGTLPKIKFFLNGKQSPAWSLRDSNGAINTQVETLGLGIVLKPGGWVKLAADNTSEASTQSLLSGVSVPITDEWLCTAIVSIVDDGGTAVDLVWGMADAAHATDADSITTSAFFQVSGGAADIFAESDNATAEVAATDTTVNYTAGTADHYWIHCASNADLQYYINGVNVLPSSTFTVAGAAGPLKFLIMCEKSTGTETFDVDLIDAKIIRFEDGAASGV